MDGTSRREVALGRLALAATSLFLALPAIRWFDGLPPLGDDASSHIVMLARIAEALPSGAGWWAPDFNLGFPIGLYYQPLPHFAGGVVTALFGGGTAAITVYKAIAVAVVALYPWGVAHGGLALGMRPVAAAAAGVLAPLVMSTLDFGLTLRSSLILGLHTQAWAAVVLPVALGQLSRALNGERGATAWATVSWTVLFLCHFFYGVASLAIAAVWVLCRPRDVLGRALRLFLVGFATALCLLFWFLPLVSSLGAMGGWPFGSAVRTDGYGFAGFLGPLLSGDLLDGEGGLPVISSLAALGAILVFSRRPRSGEPTAARRLFESVAILVATAAGAWLASSSMGSSSALALLLFGLLVALANAFFTLVPIPADLTPRLLLTAALISSAFTIGRAGFGAAVDLFIPNRGVQMFRYLGLFHLSAVWLAGFAVGRLVERVGRRRDFVPVLVVLAGLALAAPVTRGARELLTAYRTMGDTNVFLDEYFALTQAMRRATAENGAGRIFVHPRSGLRGHYHSGLLALWDGSDAGESYGVGLHDSLNFYYLEFFHPEREHSPVLMDLYGFQYIAGDGERDFSRVDADPIFESRHYTYWRVDHRVPLCGPVEVAGRVDGTPRALRRTARAWLNGNGPRRRSFYLATIPSELDIGHSTDAPVDVDERLDTPPVRGEAGRLLLDQRAPDRLECEVEMNRGGAVLFRMGYHPYWSATVDGEPAPIEMALPAFSAVEVGPGHHRVVIRYELPHYVHPLLALGLLPPSLLWFFDRRRRPRRTPRVETTTEGTEDTEGRNNHRGHRGHRGSK